VERISWDEVTEFCARLSKKTGREYHLPTEAEWEYACRAGTKTPFYFGKTITTDLANYRGTDREYEGETYPGNYGQGTHGSYRRETTEVGSFPPNALKTNYPRSLHRKAPLKGAVGGVRPSFIQDQREA
jgi:formylglycine-generating enzyme required for sulfatase activity